MDQPRDKPAAEAQTEAKEIPVRERRASNRVSDNQNSGEGSQTALSKLKMIERKLAAWRAMRKDS